jgi:gas vesicle protein
LGSFLPSEKLAEAFQPAVGDLARSLKRELLSTTSPTKNVHHKFITMSIKNILIGTLSGVAAGIAVGILIAPAEGGETRQRISDSASSLKRKLRELRGVAADELDELRDIFEREAEGMRDDVRGRVLELLKAAKERGNHIKEKAMS